MILSVGFTDLVKNNNFSNFKHRKSINDKVLDPIENEKSEIKGVPFSYVSFKGKDIDDLNLSAETINLIDRAKELALKNGEKEVSLKHIVQIAIQDSKNLLKNLETADGALEMPPLLMVLNGMAKSNLLENEASRKFLEKELDWVEKENNKSINIKNHENTSSKLTKDDITLSNMLYQVINTAMKDGSSTSIDPVLLLAFVLKSIDNMNYGYISDFIEDVKSFGKYQQSSVIKQNYLKMYDTRAMDVWNKLALGSNLNIIYNDPVESTRMVPSLIKTLKTKQNGHYNAKNTIIYPMSNNIDTTDLLEEVMINSVDKIDKNKIYLVNLDHLLLNSRQEGAAEFDFTQLYQLLSVLDEKNKILFFQKDDTYYSLKNNKTLAPIFNKFMSYSIPTIQEDETQALLTKHNLKDVTLPFTKEAKNRVIYHASNINGVFPDKAIDLMKRISNYYEDSKKKIVPQDVDDFAKVAYELFDKSESGSDVIYDTGKRLSSLYGKETTKKDIEAIIRQIKTGKIGTRGILIYAEDDEPGSGRQHTAETIAGEAKVPFLQLKTADFASYDRDENAQVIETPKTAMSKAFSEAKNAAKQNPNKTAIIYINNFEDFAFSSPYLPGYKQALGQLMDEMKNAEKEDVNILVMGSTYSADARLIPTIISGFNQYIEVDSPAFNKRSRKEILENRLKEYDLQFSYKKGENKDYMINRLVNITEYMSFVEIKSFIEKTKQIMYERGKNKASIGEFIEAYLQMVTGRTSKPEMTDYNKKATTSHECGHATNLEVMNNLLQDKGKPWHKSTNVNFITLDPRGNFLGAVFEGRDENMDYPFEAMFTGLVCAFGGYSCEKLFFGMDGSAGISQDLAQATAATKKGIEYYGFGKNTGKISNAAGIRSAEYTENVYKDLNVILKNAKLVSDLITETYKDFNQMFTNKYSKLIGTNDCMVDGDDFRKLLKNWKSKAMKTRKVDFEILDNMIMDIIKHTKKGLVY